MYIFMTTARASGSRQWFVFLSIFSLRATVAFYERGILGVVIEAMASTIPKLMRGQRIDPEMTGVITKISPSVLSGCAK